MTAVEQFQHLHVVLAVYDLSILWFSKHDKNVPFMCCRLGREDK